MGAFRIVALDCKIELECVRKRPKCVHLYDLTWLEDVDWPADGFQDKFDLDQFRSEQRVEFAPGLRSSRRSLARSLPIACKLKPIKPPSPFLKINEPNSEPNNDDDDNKS